MAAIQVRITKYEISSVMILEIFKWGSTGPLTFRKRGPMAHIGAHPTTMNLFNAESKLEGNDLSQYIRKFMVGYSKGMLSKGGKLFL